MAEPKDCVFCKIVAGELPSAKAYSDERVYAFADINPVAPVHMLVIPKGHIERVEHLDSSHDELLGHMVRVAGLVASDAGLPDDGYRLVVNQGRNAGQIVDHLHLHVLGGREMGVMA